MTAATAARQATFALMALLSLGVAAYAIAVYGFMPEQLRLHPDMRANFAARPVGIGLHVFGSSLALLLGPWQFSTRLRSGAPRWHRWSGRIYLGVAVLIGGTAGLYMAASAFGGPMARAGFAGLAIGWLWTGAAAYAAIRRGDVATHRRWMIRNFALSLAAVTLRLYLPPAFMLGIPFEWSYPVIAWACWVPNLVVAEWIVVRTRPAPG